MTLPESETSSDMQVRFEARVSDASDLEVTGSEIVVATWGDFLIATRATPTVAKPGVPIATRLRAVDYRGGGVAGVPVTVELVRSEWDETAQEQRREVMASGSVTTGADGRAHVEDHGADVARQLPPRVARACLATGRSPITRTCGSRAPPTRRTRATANPSS